MEHKQFFNDALNRQAPLLESIRQAAHKAHAAVNQTYGGGLPYAVHLDAVADGVARYGAAVCAGEDDVAAMMFGAWFHDSIEDARLTYNDVRRLALRLGLDERQAHLAVEIVYALTNDKGRTRAERAGEKYYAGIRATPYAPLVKLADRAANVRFSLGSHDGANHRMAEVYRSELPHFLAALRADGDPRMGLPSGLVGQLCADLGLAAEDYL